jgi:hypothetical protein
MSEHVEVSDLFDAFHRVAAVVWLEFGRAAAAAQDEASVPFDELMDQLEVDMFLPACARRAREVLGLEIDADDVGAHILLADASGVVPQGSAGRYHSHAFHPLELDGPVPEEVLAGNLLTRPRRELRLLLVRTPPARERSSRHSQLPVR